MKDILVAWVGFTDLDAAKGIAKAGLGPIGQAVEARSFAAVELLTNLRPEQNGPFVEWLGKRCTAPITLHQVQLSRPTAFGEIYENAVRVLEAIRRRHKAPAPKLTFHLSPGTPAMATVWLLLQPRFDAELLESSKEHGVQTVTVPFSISTDVIPDLLRKPDRELAHATQAQPPEAPEFAEILHRCDAMNRLIALAQRVAPRRVAVLIQGESGTGKELLARAVHKAGPRAGKKLVAVNCGAIPSELVESELFGHRKGAFTGAGSDRTGLLEAASGSTLFLDEIGELPLRAQVKLLRAVQEGEIVRVGETEPRPIDVRFISATNRNLLVEVAEGRFREDLFHRLAVFVLLVPPLRDRQQDLDLLIDHLLEQVNQESESEPGFQHKKISAGARNLLIHHQWPGNIRELQNTLRRAAICSDGPKIRPQDVEEAIMAVPSAQAGVLDRPLGSGFHLKRLLDEISGHYLKRGLAQAGGVKARAANLLGFANATTMTNWMKELGIQ
jgi:DNA-binding NtrC family response regulator